jgi:hypothetical protein
MSGAPGKGTGLALATTRRTQSNGKAKRWPWHWNSISVLGICRFFIALFWPGFKGKSEIPLLDC